MATIFRAEFDGTADTNVYTSYTPEVGSFSSSLQSNLELTGNGSARQQNSISGNVSSELRLANTSTTNDVEVTYQINLPTTAVYQEWWIGTRYASFDNSIRGWVVPNSTNVTLYISRFSGGAETTLVTKTITRTTAGATPIFKFVSSGSWHTLYRDGVAEVSASDSTHGSNTGVAFGGYSSAGSNATQNAYLERLQVDDFTSKPFSYGYIID